ncbi:hypothetical protein [Chondrinema litorale]|uniref:hypothetical protein n=1 Tax=Chondrinema litorale TaxID=2994555 RepID=UPI0025439E4C|nr:hypothetical protein [Chondrinema litorale]UZR95624.1 hypothetical protein OQ292_07355 [Chondrinema litorale]
MKKLLPFIFFSLSLLFSCEEDSSSDMSPSFDSGGNISQGGSLARFTILNDYLYVVDNTSLIPVQISNLSAPLALSKVEIGVGIETIFPYNNHLFIGANNAMYIYNLDNPAQPQHLSTYTHFTGCDPVVVSSNYAYVTLREGVSCASPININVLEVVDVSNYAEPFQVNSIFMNNPRGLGIGGNNKLYVCDGDFGLVQFSIDDPTIPIQDTVYTAHSANDVIVRNDLLIVTGDDGIYQYQIGEKLELLSVLPITY